MSAWMLDAVCALGSLLNRRRAPRDAEPPRELGAEFRYDIDEFRSIAPADILYREAAALKPDLPGPKGIAAGPAGSIVVAGRGRAVLMDSEGAVLKRFAFEGEATCAAAGGDGTLYIGLRSHVIALAPDGAASEWAGLGENARITSVALAPFAGEVWVADAGQRLVARFRPGGQVAGTIGGGTRARPEFLVPSPRFDLAAGPDAMWVVDPGRQSVCRYGADGRRAAAWGEAGMTLKGFSGCCNPSHIAVLPNGDLVTSEKGLARVKVHRASGELVGAVAGPAQLADATGGLDLAVDSTGRILVLDAAAGLVRVFVRKD